MQTDPQATEAVRPPRDCATMDQLRPQIDRIDRALVALMKERLGYIERAAEIKQTRDKVYDSWRIEDVVAKVKREAAKQGLPAEIAEPVWRELIARCIAHEFTAFDNRQDR